MSISLCSRSRNPRARGLLLASLLSPLLAVGCDGAAPDAAAPNARSIRMVAWAAGPDGQLAPVEHELPFEQVKAMHDQRMARMKAARAGEVAVLQQPISYLGHGAGGCTFAGCQDIWTVCGDDRTTWMYNQWNGWDLSVSDSSLIIGCIGAGASGSWTGLLSLEQINLPPFGQTWRSALRSLWSSNTFRVELQQTSGPVTSIEHVQPWTLRNVNENQYHTIGHRN